MMIIHSYVKLPEGMISQTQVEDDRKLSSQDNDSTQIQDGSRVLLPSWFKTIATIVYGTYNHTYSLGNIQKTMEYHHFHWETHVMFMAMFQFASKSEPRDGARNNHLTTGPHWSRLPDPSENPSTIQLPTSFNIIQLIFQAILKN